MPLYEYRCTQCDHKFEKIQGYDAPEVMECPACKGEAVRMISRAAVQFKGSGFYSTDYGAKLGSAASEKSNDGSAASTTDSKTGDTDKGAGKAASPTDGSSPPSTPATPAPSTPAPSASSPPAASPASKD